MITGRAANRLETIEVAFQQMESACGHMNYRLEILAQILMQKFSEIIQQMVAGASGRKRQVVMWGWLVSLQILLIKILDTYQAVFNIYM